LDEVEDVAAFGAAATVPDLLLNVNAESVVTATSWAWPDKLLPRASEAMAATFKLALDGDGFGEGEDHSW
jgi:hypothetical protein